MNGKEKIEYMIQCLELARDEVAYAENFDFDARWSAYGARQPNGTIIRESLKMVGRLANITAKEITLSPYCNEVFEKQGGDNEQSERNAGTATR